MTLQEARSRMERCLTHFDGQLRMVRLSGITAGMVDTVKVLIQGGKVEIRQVASTSDTKDGVTVRPHVKDDISPIVTGLNAEGVKAFASGKVVFCPVPAPTIDDKKKVESYIKKLGDEAKVALRMVRQEVRNKLTKEELKEQDKKIQNMIDEFTKTIDEYIQRKLKSELWK